MCRFRGPLIPKRKQWPSGPRLSLPMVLAAFVIFGSQAAFAAGPTISAQRPPYRVPAQSPTPSVTAPQQLQLPQHFETDVTKISQQLDLLIRTALERNPDLAAAKAALTAAIARVPQAGMPDDPSIGYRLKDMPTTFSWTRENATEQQSIFQMTYPFPGKLTLRQESAAKESELTREQLDRTRLQLVTAVKSAFADIFVVDKDIELQLEERQMLRDLISVATAKYKVGAGIQQDILNADVALSKLDTTLVELARKRRTREIRMATLLNQDSIEIPPLGDLPQPKLRLSPLELQQIVLEINPEIREREKAVERDELKLRLAKIAVLPDLGFEVDYGVRMNNVKPSASPSSNYRPDMVSGLVSFKVPIFYYWKQREEVVEAQANLSRSRFQLQAVRQRTFGALNDLLQRLAQHQQVAVSLRDQVIPLARTAVSASISAYQLNKVDFLTLLDAQQKLDRYQADYWYNEAARFGDLAQIDEVTGGSLDRTTFSK